MPGLINFFFTMQGMAAHQEEELPSSSLWASPIPRLLSPFEGGGVGPMLAVLLLAEITPLFELFLGP